MSRLQDLKVGEMTELMRVLARSGLDRETAREIIRNPDVAKDMISAIKVPNPFALSVEEQVNRLRLASKEEGWSFTDEVFQHLIDTAPTWPIGRSFIRSFRIRFGNGPEGVVETFLAHERRIQRVIAGTRVWRYEMEEPLLTLSVAHHGPCVEWVCLNLGAHQNADAAPTDLGRSLITWRSCADEVLVALWLFPNLFEKYLDDPDRIIFLAGYNVHDPDYPDEPMMMALVPDDGLKLSFYDGEYFWDDGGCDYAAPEWTGKE